MEKKRKMAEEVEEIEVKKKKKKCKYKYEHEKESKNGSHSNLEEDEDGIMEEMKLKRKKKKQRTEGKKTEVEVEEIETIVKKKHKKKKKHQSQDDVEDETKSQCLNIRQEDESDPAHKLKKKKKKKERECSETIESLADTAVVQETNGGANTSDIVQRISKKKKKNKKHKSTEKESPQDNSPNSTQQLKSYEDINNSETKPTIKEGSGIGLSKNQKNGLNQQAPITTGQWHTAGFEDETRQQKFLRLMGGFKKGTDTSSIQNKFQLGSKGGNTAMTKEQEKKYQNELGNQFDKALAFKMDRGKEALGLGFKKPEGEGKKFHIDTSKSRSVKFDD